SRWLAVMVRTALPVAVSQTLMVLSQLAVASRSPRGSNASPHTDLVCPFSVYRLFPEAASHSTAVVSEDAVASPLPLGLDRSLQSWSVCPHRVSSGVGVPFWGAGGSVRALTASSRKKMDPKGIPCLSMATSLSWVHRPRRSFVNQTLTVPSP